MVGHTASTGDVRGVSTPPPGSAKHAKSLRRVLVLRHGGATGCDRFDSIDCNPPSICGFAAPSIFPQSFARSIAKEEFERRCRKTMHPGSSPGQAPKHAEN